MGSKKKAALSTKNTNAGTKQLTPAQLKKQARKAEIAAAKAQGDAVKSAAGFNPVAEVSSLAGSMGEGVEIEYLKEVTPEVRTAAAEIIADEAPAVGKAALEEDGVCYLIARREGGMVGFVAYHFAFEEDITVCSLDWVAVAEPARRQGVASGLLSAVVQHAQATQMQGVRAPVHESWTSTHPSRAFLAKAGFEMCAVQPMKGGAVMSQIWDAEAKGKLESRAEQLRKERKAAEKKETKGGRPAVHEPCAHLF